MAANDEEKKSPLLAEEDGIQVPATAKDTIEVEMPYEVYRRSMYGRLMELQRGVVVSDDDSDTETVRDPQSYSNSVESVGDTQSDSDSDSDLIYAKRLLKVERPMTEAEKAQYEQQIKESQGFEVPLFGKVFYYSIAPVAPALLHLVPHYARVAKQALDLHKRKTGEIFVLVEIVKANENRIFCGTTSETYFTLKLRDERGLQKIYRAWVKHSPGTIEMPLFEEYSGLSSGSCASKEMDVICNDNSGASTCDGNVVRETRKRSFATIAE